MNETKKELTHLEESILSLVNQTNEEVGNENSNKDARIAPTQRDLIAGEVSKDISMRLLLSPEVSEAHKNGAIHFHDLDYYVQKGMFNCCLVNIKDMLENGTTMNGKMVERPKSFQVACTVLTQIIAAVASSQYGGQTMNVKHLAVFLYETRQKFRRKLHEQFGGRLSEEVINEIAEQRLRDELSAGVQTIQYQINTLMGTNGQAPFVTLFLELDPKDPYIKETALIIEEIFKQRIVGIKNESWVYITPAFPKLVYVLDEHNALKGGEYDYLTKIAVQCSAKRMYPDYISAKKMRENYEGNVFGCMWCRAFLSPYKDKDGNYKFEGRFNQGVVTINLPQIWLETQGYWEDAFWKLFDERCELVYKALMERHEALKGTKAEYAPLLWQHGGLARLNKDDKIDAYLENGYSTLSMGYIGIYETTYLVKKCSHTTEEGKAFAMKLIKRLREKIDEWKAKTGIGFALYGTPAESLCYRFARIDKEKFGDVHNVTDKGYYTNSYHVDVREDIDAFSKLSFESEFQPVSSGGAISYVEIPNMSKNLLALETLVKYIYDNIQYAEFNTKCDCCQTCGFEGEILLDENNEWYCPNCWERDKHKMTVVRRTCFTKDNLVLTKDGYKNIDEVKIGDEVLTFKNRFKPVVEKREFDNKEVIKITSPAIDEIVCTPDHPFWVRSLIEPRKANWRIKKLILSEPYIKQAKYLDRNDYLLSLKSNREVDIDIEWLPTDKYDFWWVVGRILADGWVSKPYQRKDCKTISKVVWLCSGKHEVKTVQEKIDKLWWLFGKASERETTFVWRSYNHDLYSFLEKIGSWAINKEIPAEWLDLPIEKCRALLDGLLSWDGHVTNNGLCMIRSVSRKLVYGVKHLVAKIYWVNAKVYTIRAAGEESILWRKVNVHAIYDVKWFNIQPKGSQVFYKDWYLHSPVKKVEEFWRDKVYSLTVLDDASYTVGEVAVLNCGYLWSNYFNKGKTNEIKNRVLHL